MFHNFHKLPYRSNMFSFLVLVIYRIWKAIENRLTLHMKYVIKKVLTIYWYVANLSSDFSHRRILLILFLCLCLYIYFIIVFLSISCLSYFTWYSLSTHILLGPCASYWYLDIAIHNLPFINTLYLPMVVRGQSCCSTWWGEGLLELIDNWAQWG